MTTRPQSREVFQHDQIGNWRVVSEAPVRTNEKLIWTISCPNNHEVQVEHASLSYGVVPMQCAACIEAERVARAAIKADERRLVAKVAAEIRAAQQEKYQAVQIDGIDKSEKTRAIHIEQVVAPQQQEYDDN